MAAPPAARRSTVEGGQPTATGAPTEGGGQLTNTGEGEQPNSETDTRTEIWCVSKPDSIGRSYDGTTDGGTIPIDLTFTDGTNDIITQRRNGLYRQEDVRFRGRGMAYRHCGNRADR